MLDLMRKKASSWAVKFIFGLIIAVFVLWGVGTMREDKQTEFATVGNTRISVNEFRDTYDRLTENYRSILGDKFDFKIFEKQIKDGARELVLERAILSNKATELGVTVSDAEIIKEIQGTSAFQEGGQFSKPRYLAVLNASRMSASAYERDVERQLLTKKTKEILKAAVPVNPQDIKAFYDVKNRSIRAGFVKFSAESFKSGVSVTEDEEKKYYAENKDSYKMPDGADISYLFLPFTDFIAGINPTEQDIKDYYDGNKQDFLKKKSYVFRHVFAAAMKPEDKEKAKKKIENAKVMLKESSFDIVAGKVNDDATRDRGGLVGEVTAEMITPKIAGKLFSMKAGDVSDIVESEYGFHILKVDEIKDERLRPIDEIKDELKELVKTHKAKLLALKKATDLKTPLLTKKDLPSPYQVKKAMVEKDAEVIGELGRLPDVTKTIFETADGGAVGPLTLSGGIFVGRIDKHNKGNYPFEKVKDKVRDAVISKKAMDAAKVSAEAAIKKDAVGTGEEVDWFTPVTGAPGRFSNLEGLGKDILSLSSQRRVLPVPYKGTDGWFIVYFIAEDMKAWDSATDETKKFAEDFIMNKRDAYYSEWLKAQKKGKGVKVNEDTFKGI